jgi:hypothetical protein
MEPDQLLVVDAGVVTDAAVEQPVGGEAVTGGMVGGTEAGTVAGETAGVTGGTTGGDAPVAGEVVAEGGTTAGEVGGDVTVTAGTEGGVVGGVSVGVAAGETAGDVAQGGEQVEEEAVCDEVNPETCVCEPTEENACQEQEVATETQQPTKGEDDSCNQIGASSPLMIAVIAAFTMKKIGSLFR